MRMFLYFDLPTTTKADLRNYRKFRKFLINEGFIMQQESVYSKLVLNSSNSKLQHDRIVQNAPPNGLVELLIITEKQYSGIHLIVGENPDKVFDTTERLVII